MGTDSTIDMNAVDECGGERDAALVRQVEGFIRELAGYKTQFDVFRLMKRVTEYFGMRSFMVMNMPTDVSSSLSANSIISNWPVELVNDYDAALLLSSSPVLIRLRQSTVPMNVSMDEIIRQRDASTSVTAADVFQRFGIRTGACASVHDAMGNRGIVSLIGSRPVLNLLELMSFNFIAIHVFHRLIEIRELDQRVSEMLTEREIECLNWAAAGKTSVETSEIMKLSEHTINHYLNRATKKLDTVNRRQAVAKALRLGFIK